jgi:hypothetical protein
VPTATLRSWNQRYGIGPADHDRGRHRRYSAADIATVQRMHRLMGEGADPRSAAVFDLDLVRVGTLLDRHVRHYGVVETWDQLIRPGFAALNEHGHGAIHQLSAAT